MSAAPPTRLRMLGARLRLATSGALVRSVGVLVGGAAAGHLLTAATMPLATRLFSPEDFSVAATFSSIVGLLVVAACLRFELAIALPDGDREALDLLGLAVLSSVAVSILLAASIAVLPSSVAARLDQPGIEALLWLVPVATLMGGVYLALQMWFVRKSAFPRIARSRVIQSALANGGQIGLGAVGVAPLGLVIGQILNVGGGSLVLGAAFLRERPRLWREVTWSGMWDAARRYSRFPRYSVWEALANSASIHFPILLIASLAPVAEVGFLSLSIFLMQAPMALFGNAVGQVYLAEAPQAAREGRLAPFTLRMVQNLFRMITAPIAAAAILSPALFAIVFGAEWARSGELVAWMAPWFVLQFVTSPIATALHVEGRQRIAMALQVFGLLFRTAAVIVASRVAGLGVSEAYALSGFLFYLAYLLLVIRAVGIRAARLGRVVVEAVGLAALGAALGFGGLGALRAIGL